MPEPSEEVWGTLSTGRKKKEKEKEKKKSQQTPFHSSYFGEAPCGEASQHQPALDTQQPIGLAHSSAHPSSWEKVPVPGVGDSTS